MVLGLSLRVSWICLLLFSSGACFPATQGVDKYGSNLQSEGSSRPLHLSSGSPVTYDAHIPIVPYSGVGSRPMNGAASGLYPSGNAGQPSRNTAAGDHDIPFPYGSRPMNGAASGFVYSSGNAGHPSRNTAAGDHDIPFPYGSRPMNGAASGFVYSSGNAGHPSRNTAAGDHDIPFPYGSSPMYGASSGFAYPSGNAGQPSRNTAAGDHDIPFPYGSRPMNGAASGFAYPSSVSSAVGTGKKTPGSPVQHQPAAGSSRMYGSSSFAYPAGNAGHPSRNTAVGAHGISFPHGSSSRFAYPAGNTGHSSRNAAAGDHDIPFPYAASGFVYPSGNAGQPSRSTAAGSNRFPYGSAVSGSSHHWGSQPAGAVASPGFATDGAASDLNTWIEARPFIDLSFLESAQGMPLSGSQETSPPMPSSYIVQSRNGYIRDRQAFSDKTYSPEYPEPPVMMSKTVSAPGFVSKGGKKV